MNTVVRLLIKKNVVTDLARISHSLDLSSPHLAATINASLKPLEVISRIVNQPAPVNPNRSKLKSESATQDSVNNTNTGKLVIGPYVSFLILSIKQIVVFQGVQAIRS